MARLISVSKARDEFADVFNRVAFAGERVVVGRRGKTRVAMVPIEDFELLESLEDKVDLAAARKALREKGAVPLADLKKKLGL